MAFTENIAEFMDTETGFAVNATIGAATVAVIFDAAYSDTFGVAGTAPVCHAASADVSTVALGTSVTIDSLSFTVVGIEPDGTGITRLRLQEA